MAVAAETEDRAEEAGGDGEEGPPGQDPRGSDDPEQGKNRGKKDKGPPGDDGPEDPPDGKDSKKQKKISCGCPCDQNGRYRAAPTMWPRDSPGETSRPLQRCECFACGSSETSVSGNRRQCGNVLTNYEAQRGRNLCLVCRRHQEVPMMSDLGVPRQTLDIRQATLVNNRELGGAGYITQTVWEALPVDPTEVRYATEGTYVNFEAYVTQVISLPGTSLLRKAIMI